MNALLLARAQFAFTISFHFLFPAFSIGLASFLAVLEGLWLRTGSGVYANLYRYWLKIFAVVFGMGVVSGLVMSYQFGTNWSVFSDKAGPVIGPLMAYEVLTAFFLEAGFLGVMLFGINKVGRKLHFVATLAVAGGTFISAFWILAVNSWMQTPTGYEISPDGRFMPGPSWLAIIFNPSFPYRLVHTVLAAYLTTAFAVGGVGAWHLLKDAQNPGARKMFSMAMWMAALVAPIQILAGDAHGINTLEHQPAKVMAMEGHFHSHPHGAPLILFGQCAAWRARYHCCGRSAVGGDRVLGIPGHGRTGAGDGDTRAVEPGGPMARAALHHAAVASCRAGYGPCGIYRRAGGMGRDRNRPPAVYRLWPVAHRSQRCAFDRADGRDVARGVCTRLFYRVRHGYCISAETCGQATTCA